MKEWIKTTAIMIAMFVVMVCAFVAVGVLVAMLDTIATHYGFAVGIAADIGLVVLLSGGIAALIK